MALETSRSNPKQLTFGWNPGFSTVFYGMPECQECVNASQEMSLAEGLRSFSHRPVQWVWMAWMAWMAWMFGGVAGKVACPAASKSF